jgi:hypothetical protein
MLDKTIAKMLEVDKTPLIHQFGRMMFVTAVSFGAGELAKRAYNNKFGLTGINNLKVNGS